jgi:uncharacterized protein YuzE
MDTVLSRLSPLASDPATADRLRSFALKYDSRRDVLFLRPTPPVAATSIDCDGQLWLRVRIDTGEVAGLEIEDFKAVFLPRHPQLRSAWEGLRGPSNRATSRDAERPFVDLLVSHVGILLAECVRDHRREVLATSTTPA